MKHLLAITLCALFASCINTPVEHLRVPFDEPGWTGQQKDHGRGKGTISELWPANETPYTWTQLATIQFFEGHYEPARSMMERLRASMETRRASGASVTWNVITESINVASMSWSIFECLI